MRYEVEQKFRVDRFDEVESALAELGATIGAAIEQVDCYWAHPARDFATTDEAFRLRWTGESNAITYKGPKIDSTTKTRRELELPLPPGEAYRRQFSELLQCLGFRSVAEVRKRRRKSFVDWENSRIEVSLDELEQVGLYAELELVADEDGLAVARQHLAGLAQRLRLEHGERRSYLELLLLRCS